MRKFLLFCTLSLFISLNIKAQVAGISASKLNTFNAYTIALHHLEVEPSFSWKSSRSAFDAQRNRYFYSPNKDSLIYSKELFLRCTYSPFKNLEIGTMITSDLSSLSVGLKYLFFDDKKFAASFITGANWSGQCKAQNIDNTLPGPETRVSAYVGGIAITGQFTKRLSWDTDIQYQNSFAGSHSFLNDYFVDSELGYYVFDQQLQLIGGFGFHYQNFKTTGTNAYTLIFNPGITIETGESYIIVLYTPINLIGKNMEIDRGINLAFTLDID